MSQNYLNLGKLYTLTSTNNICITGASLIHGIYNGANANIMITIDNQHGIHVAADQSVTFPNPVPFKTIKTSAATATGIILYS
jgi:hypothetical protein